MRPEEEAHLSPPRRNPWTVATAALLGSPIDELVVLGAVAGARAAMRKNPELPVNTLTLADADAVLDLLGLEMDTADKVEFLHGLEVEYEHAATVGGDWAIIGQIVLDHLEEDDQYYRKLKRAMRHNPTEGEVDRFLALDKEKTAPRRVASSPSRAPAASSPKTKCVGGSPAKLEARTADNVALAMTGDPYAQQQVQHEFMPYVKGIAKKLAGRAELFPGQKRPAYIEHMLDDIALEVFTRLWRGTSLTEENRQRDRKRPYPVISKWNRGPFTTFIAGVTRKVTQELVRKAAREHEAETRAELGLTVAGASRVMEEMLASPEEKQTSKEQMQLIEMAMATLDEKFATVMQARAAGMSYAEISEHLGIPVRTVMTRLYRARRKIEELTGIPLKGLVGKAARLFAKDGKWRSGGAPDLEPVFASSSTKQPARSVRRNPDDEGEEGDVWVYFETVNDLLDLKEAGILDEEAFEQCVEALDEQGLG